LIAGKEEYLKADVISDRTNGVSNADFFYPALI